MGHGGDGISLNGVADAKRGDGGKEGEEHSEPLPSQSTLEGIHRSTEHLSFLGLHTILNGQQSLGILGRDTKHTREPAPKHGTRTSKGNGCGNTHDITRADGGGKGRGKRSKLRHIARSIGILLHREMDSLEDETLGKAQADGEEHVGAKEQDNHGPAPKQAA